MKFGYWTLGNESWTPGLGASNNDILEFDYESGGIKKVLNEISRGLADNEPNLNLTKPTECQTLGLSELSSAECQTLGLGLSELSQTEAEFGEIQTSAEVSPNEVELGKRISL